VHCVQQVGNCRYYFGVKAASSHCLLSVRATWLSSEFSAISCSEITRFCTQLRPVQNYAFCLSNAMHGQNINLPVCVCVCVSITLSVNSPTGQTPQWIFTVDSLKDADLRKDVPYGGLDDEQSHLGVKSLPKPQFWGCNKHFEPNMQKIQIAIQLYRQICVSD